MLRAIYLVCIVLVFYLHLTNGISSNKNDLKECVKSLSTKPLILTPYIKKKWITLGHFLARVNLDSAKGIKSYSGFLTVDKMLGTNLFFWFFPSKNDFTKDPVILWLQGGSKNSVMLGIFVEHGPFLLKEDKLELRKYSWINNHSVLYMDNSHAGFSFHKKNVTISHDKIVDDLYNALYQFFEFFPRLRDNYFYITGQSHAANFITSLGYKIMTKNGGAKFQINLKGMAIGNAVVDPSRQFKFGNYLSQLGVINNDQRSQLLRIEKSITTCVENEDYDAANKNMNDLELLFLNCTYDKLNPINYVDTDHNLQFYTKSYSSYVYSIRDYIHAGTKTSFSNHFEVFDYLLLPTADNEEFKIIELLKKYRMLFYTGHLDTIVSPARVSEFLENMNFSGVKSLKLIPKYQWYVDGKIAGYVKAAGKLTVVTVMNAGQMVPFDQPKRSLNMITRFTRNEEID